MLLQRQLLSVAPCIFSLCQHPMHSGVLATGVVAPLAYNTNTGIIALYKRSDAQGPVQLCSSEAVAQVPCSHESYELRTCEGTGS